MSQEFILSIETNIDEKILRNKSIIEFQEKEILKAKYSLLELQNCLLNQNKALSIFIQEEYDIELEIKDRIDSPKSLNKLNKDDKEKSNEVRELKRKNSDDIVGDKNDNGASKTIDNTVQKRVRLVEGTQPSEQNGTGGMLIPELLGAVIDKLIVKKGSIFLASKGMLLKRGGDSTLIYDIDKGSVIVDVQLINSNKLEYILVSTDRKILMFHLNKSLPHKMMDLPGIKHVSRNSNLVYLTHENGSIKKLDPTIWKVSDCITIDRVDIKRKFYISFDTNLYFATLKDEFFYKINSKQPTPNPKIVKGVKNVKNILVLKKMRQLCCSEDTAWLLNKECLIEESLICAHGIKLAESEDKTFVLVSRDNVVRLFNVTKENKCEKMIERKFEGDITALSIHCRKVFVAIGNQIFRVHNRS